MIDVPLLLQCARKGNASLNIFAKNDTVNVANAEEFAKLVGEEKVFKAVDEFEQGLGCVLEPQDILDSRDGVEKECLAISGSKS